MVRFPKNKKRTYWLNCWPQMWSVGFTVAMTMTFSSWPWPWIFKVKYGICYISDKSGLIAKKQKQTYRLNSRPQMWSLGLILPMTLTLNFQGQIWTLLYLSPKCPNCHQTKIKYTDSSLGLKCDHRAWLWPWPGIFKVKYCLCYIPARNGKQTYRLNSRLHMWPMALTLAMTLILNFQGQIRNLLV